jgi:hypothetical protein
MAMNVRTAITITKLIQTLKDNADTHGEPLNRAGLAISSGVSYSRVSALVSDYPEYFTDTGECVIWTGNTPDVGQFSRVRQEAYEIKRRARQQDYQGQMLEIMRSINFNIGELAAKVNGNGNNTGNSTAEQPVGVGSRNRFTVNVPGGLIKRLAVIIDKRNMWDKINPMKTPIKAESALDMLCLLLAVKRYFEDDALVAKADVLLKRLEANT